MTDDSSSGSNTEQASTGKSFSTLTLVGIAAGVIAVAVVGIAIILRRVRAQTIAQTPVPGAGFLDPYMGQTSPTTLDGTTSNEVNTFSRIRRVDRPREGRNVFKIAGWEIPGLLCVCA